MNHIDATSHGGDETSGRESPEVFLVMHRDSPVVKVERCLVISFW